MVGQARQAAGDRLDRRDALACVALATGSAFYVLMSPRSLGASDEAYYFYHAVRLLAGDILYRDMSELVTPLFVDLHALLFWLFGADMATARIASAGVQAGIVVAIYAGARCVGARRLASVAAACAYLAVAYPAWPYGTPHWLSTLLISLLLLSLLGPSSGGIAGTLLQGLLVGLLVANQQQKGIVFAAAVCVLKVAEALGGTGAAIAWSSLAAHLAVLAAGALAVVVPLLGAHVALAGPAPVFRQLVLQPLTGYREVNAAPWGSVSVLSVGLARYTFVPLLKYLPLVVVVDTVRLLVAWWRGDARRLPALLVLVVFGVASAAGTLYRPDFIHIAFIMPVVLVAVTESVGWALGERGLGGIPFVDLVALAVIAVSGLVLYRDVQKARAEFPISVVTAFGRIDVSSTREAALIERTRHLLDATPGRELFCYPGWAALSLTTGANNPTRHDLIMPRYESDEEVQGVIDALERRRVPYVLVIRPMTLPGDPVIAYVDAHYRCGGDGICIRNTGQGDGRPAVEP